MFFLSLLFLYILDQLGNTVVNDLVFANSHERGELFLILLTSNS